MCTLPNGTEPRKRTFHRGRAKLHGAATALIEIFIFVGLMTKSLQAKDIPC